MQGVLSYLLNLLIVCRSDILVTDRISSVVIDGEHHVKLEQVHQLNKQARYREQAEAVSTLFFCKSRSTS